MMDLAQFKTQLSSEGLAAFKFSASVEYFWSYELRATREQAWAILSDTSRLNREMGFGSREQEEVNGRLLVRTKMVGLSQVWIEEPWLWLNANTAGGTMVSTRIYQKGLAEKMYSVFYLQESVRADHQIIFIYFSWIPKNSFWAWFLKSTGDILKKKFAEAFKKIEASLTEAPANELAKFAAAPPPLSPASRQKLEGFQTLLAKKGLDPSVVARLLHAIEKSDDLDLEPLRLRPLAKAWSVDERELIKICLFATRLGLLKLSWDVICPHCRGSRFSAGTLGEIPEAAECEICEVQFSTSDQDSIEVMFHVHPSIRKVEALAYCAAEPAKKSHIRVQANCEPSATLQLKLELPAGQYRARAKNQSWILEIDPQSSEDSVAFTSGTANLRANCAFQMRFENENAEPTLFVLEEVHWGETALRPAQILGIPEFRDLFSEEHLNSNVKLYLGEQVILFTDIVGSTQFYQEVGDARAFAEVRAHFQEVFQIVGDHRGAVVKTIGDSVMASFLSIAEAVTAALAVQTRFSSQRKDTAIRLRISVHSGPVIAVQLNNGLDFFGATVNQAAKNQMMASAYEIACSEEIYQKYLKLTPESYPLEVRKNSRESSTPNAIYILRASAHEAVPLKTVSAS